MNQSLLQQQQQLQLQQPQQPQPAAAAYSTDTEEARAGGQVPFFPSTEEGVAKCQLALVYWHQAPAGVPNPRHGYRAHVIVQESTMPTAIVGMTYCITMRVAGPGIPAGLKRASDANIRALAAATEGRQADADYASDPRIAALVGAGDQLPQSGILVNVNNVKGKAKEGGGHYINSVFGPVQL